MKRMQVDLIAGRSDSASDEDSKMFLVRVIAFSYSMNTTSVLRTVRTFSISPPLDSRGRRAGDGLRDGAAFWGGAAFGDMVTSPVE